MVALGLITKKQEMTRMWLGHKYVPVTLLSVVPQLIVRYKTLEKDGYDAVVIGAEKKILEKEKGIKEKYGMMMEVSIDSSYKESHEVGKILDASEFADVQEVTIQSVSKGKGFQGVMKRHNASGMPKTHGHKFTRVGGSKGNRKPRRVQKGHPHAGHMGVNLITLKNRPIVDIMSLEGKQFLVVKGAVPGGKNTYVKVTATKK